MARLRQRGFTLMELALVMLILGILTAGAVAPLRAGLEQARSARTQAGLERARQALLGYAASHAPPRLPCPDCRTPACAGPGNHAGDGFEDRSVDGDRCDAGTGHGHLPWATLGVSATDAWGRRLGYRVAPLFATGFDLDTGNRGSARILAVAGAERPAVLAEGIPAVFWSHGANGRGATSGDGSRLRPPPAASEESENLDDDRDFVSGPTRAASAGHAGFDDRLGWVNAYELKYLLLVGGRLP